METTPTTDTLAAGEFGSRFVAPGGSELPARSPKFEELSLTNEVLRASLARAVALLQPAQERIELLQMELRQAKEVHHKDVSALVAAGMREAETRAELDRALTDLAANQRQALRQEILKQERNRERAWWRLGR